MADPMKVLVVLPVNDIQKSRLEQQGKDYIFDYVAKKDLTDSMVTDADIIIGNVPPKMIHASPKLKLFQLNSAGANEYITPGILSKDTILANATGAYSKTVAEHALALTLSLMKKLYMYRDNQRSSKWMDLGTVSSFDGAVVAVVGFGDIGQYYAKLAKAFGAYIIGVKRRPGEKPECADELYDTSALKDVLKRADIVFSILPETPSTVHLYTKDLFDAMKSSAIFINCGRGSVVAGSVLYDALSAHAISAAAIDVCEQEPLPADSPLWALDNLFITPHVAGGYHLPDTLDKIVDIAAYNLMAFQNNMPVKNAVDFSTGYKK